MILEAIIWEHLLKTLLFFFLRNVAFSHINYIGNSNTYASNTNLLTFHIYCKVIYILIFFPPKVAIRNIKAMQPGKMKGLLIHLLLE